MAGQTFVNPELIIKQLREEHEKDKQLIYDYKRKIDSFEILEKEYQEEIERLNHDKISMVNELEIKIEQFEEEKCLLRNNNNEEVNILQKESEDLKLEIVTLKKEIHLSKNRESLMLSEDPSKEDIEELKTDIRQLEDTLENLNIQHKLTLEQCSDLKEMNQILKSENESLQENFNLKREELQQANELIKDFQDNIMCLKTELDFMKNKPLDEQSHGNSLFAEVNDSRVQLLKKLKVMVAKYNEMAKDRESLLKEIEILRCDKARMIRLFETDIGQYQPGNLNEINAYRSTIDGLMKLIANYKEELVNVKKINNSALSKDLKYFETCLKSKEKEIQSLRDTVEVQSTSHILKARNISELGREMVNWKWKASQLENQIQILNKKITELEKGYNKELRKSQILIATDFDEKCEEDKENKKVIKNSVKVNNEKIEKSNVLKEKPFSENKTCEVQLKSAEIEKLKENTLETVENNETVIDLTDDFEETEVKKTVHFSENTKEESRSKSVMKCTVIKTHLPITNYRKKNTK